MKLPVWYHDFPMFNFQFKHVDRSQNHRIQKIWRRSFLMFGCGMPCYCGEICFFCEIMPICVPCACGKMVPLLWVDSRALSCISKICGLKFPPFQLNLSISTVWVWNTEYHCSIEHFSPQLLSRWWLQSIYLCIAHNACQSQVWQLTGLFALHLALWKLQLLAIAVWPCSIFGSSPPTAYTWSTWYACYAVSCL